MPVMNQDQVTDIIISHLKSARDRTIEVQAGESSAENMRNMFIRLKQANVEPNVVTAVMKQLVSAGIVELQVYRQLPPAVENRRGPIMRRYILHHKVIS